MIKETFCTENHIDIDLEQRIIAAVPDEDEAVDAAALFAHLSDSTRVRLLAMLCFDDLCVCELADMLHMSQPAVSHHLRILRECGIIRCKKVGKRTCYYLNREQHGNMIRELLGIVCGRKKNDGELK